MGCRGSSGAGRWVVCGGPLPPPSPSRDRYAAPDPAPQAPEGLRTAGAVTCCGFSSRLRRRPGPTAPSVRRR
ncbi:hypothetical protein DBP15_26885 [Streptomyces sp. CS065A]|nr:hypothetical protein DBP15_26885 [Streptomyces sp. CS065A]